MDCCKEKDCCPCKERIECLQAQINWLAKQVDELNRFSFAMRFPRIAENEEPRVTNSLIAIELDELKNK